MRGWSYKVLYVYRRTTNANDDDDDDEDGKAEHWIGSNWLDRPTGV